jgi:nucleotide-binding universal stress UspA family protein
VNDTVADSASPRPRGPVTSHPASPGLREILFTSDLSTASDRAFDHACLIAERFDAHLVLYHALELDVSPPRGSVERELRRRLERAAREHLERRAATSSAHTDVHVERTASAAHALLTYIHDARPDLTVMSTHGRQGVARLVLGSMTERVLETVSGPTLCVREPEHGSPLPYRRIVVPTDMSDASRRAFPVAAMLARAFDAQVLAVHAADIRSGRATWGITRAIDDALPSEAAVADFLSADFQGVRVLPRTEVGSAWDCITRIAAEERADVIVMSTHGVDSVADRFLGSHAERVVRQAPCPVLVVAAAWPGTLPTA